MDATTQTTNAMITYLFRKVDLHDNGVQETEHLTAVSADSEADARAIAKLDDTWTRAAAGTVAITSFTRMVGKAEVPEKKQDLKFDHEWQVTIRAEGHDGAMAAAWFMWETWNKGHEPCSVGNHTRELGPLVDCDIRKTKGPDLTKQ